MKNIFVSITLTLVISSITMAATFKCLPPKNNSEAFLTSGFAIISVYKQEMRLQHYDGDSRDSVLLRDYTYTFKRLSKAKGKVAGMMKFDLVRETKSYGDSLPTLYVAESLAAGKPGALIFAGHGYSWDWNFCKPVGL
jgi:hypothetical protein